MSMLSDRDVVCKMLDAANAWESLSKLFETLDRSQEEKLRVDQTEREMFGYLMELGLRLLKSYVQSAGDGDQGECIAHPKHGELRRSANKHAKPYQSIFGEFEILRWTYQKRERQKALHIPLEQLLGPLDQLLGLPKQKQSYVLEDWIGRLCVKEPFEQSVKTLHELLGVKTSVRSAERINRELAEHVPTLEKALTPPPPEEEDSLLVVTVDGKGVPMRRSLDQRKHEELGTKLYKPQSTVGYEKTLKRRTAGANKSRKQMAYVAAMYSISPFLRSTDDILNAMARNARASERPRPKSKRFYAEMTKFVDGELVEGPQRLFSKLAKDVEARNQAATPKPVICLMDGQRSFWFHQVQFLAYAIAIIDIFHVIEYLWQAAYCHHPQGSVQAEKYVNKYLRRILDGKVAGVIRSLKGQLPGTSNYLFKQQLG